MKLLAPLTMEGVCRDKCCGGKTCYQMSSITANTADHELFYCARVGTHLHWKFPASVIGAPGDYHFSIITSDDEIASFSKDSVGRPFDIWINNVHQGFLKHCWFANQQVSLTCSDGLETRDTV